MAGTPGNNRPDWATISTWVDTHRPDLIPAHAEAKSEQTMATSEQSFLLDIDPDGLITLSDSLGGGTVISYRQARTQIAEYIRNKADEYAETLLDEVAEGARDLEPQAFGPIVSSGSGS